MSAWHDSSLTNLGCNSSLIPCSYIHYLGKEISSPPCHHTVDGRTPAPPGIYKTPVNNGDKLPFPQLVSRISSIDVMWAFPLELDGILPWSSRFIISKQTPEAADETAKAKVDHILVPWVAFYKLPPIGRKDQWTNGPMDLTILGHKASHPRSYQMFCWILRVEWLESETTKPWWNLEGGGVQYGGNLSLIPLWFYGWNLEEMPPFGLREKISTNNKNHQVFRVLWYIKVFFGWM